MAQARREVTRRIPAWKHLAVAGSLLVASWLLLHFADRFYVRNYMRATSGLLVFVAAVVGFTAGAIEYDVRE
jgi:hypothetical protein